MFMSRRLASLLIASALAFPAAGAAMAQHSHAGVSELQQMALDHGKKWPTDEALRAGMASIHEAMNQSLPRIHEGQFGPADYTALADTIQGRVDTIVANCKLPEEADLQLHYALTHMLGGLEAMKDGPDRESGAVAVVEAISAYGAHFEHPGWTGLRH
ncbi:hypothetical protein NK718_02590 [Alsobacter sp. SYSU M60028]|uniref:DnrO protein n=1 Tax=Alsobacter ponti TaxID=2962936 RepID=A0ABT1L7F7_9HYPH|nr:hypothetical protein [Alsobacter ponti]MCP8937390.1 hypothetical protein [Alsobacter ponti]